MNPERKVLMLCYYFPPLLATGANRSVAFAQLLPSYGWKPTVLTVKKPQEPWERLGATIPEGVDIRRSREWNIVRICDFLHAACIRIFRVAGIDVKRNWFRELLCVPDSQITWSTLFPALKLARQADVIYVSCSPFSAAVKGAWLKIATKKPLVLDFRDAWTLNPHIQHSWLHKTISRKKERFVLQFADHLIVNTEGAKRVYLQTYPALAKRISVIPNGYDRLTPVKSSPPGSFTIMHMGTFYGERNPDTFLQALSELPDLAVEFVQIGGTFDSAEKFRDKVKMRIIEPVPHEEALRHLGGASLLYLKQGFEAGITDYIAVAAKTYEYLATGLPILADVPEGDNATIVRHYAARSYVVTSNSVADLKQAIRQAYNDRGLAVSSINAEFIEKFDRRKLSGDLAEVFEKVCEKTVS